MATGIPPIAGKGSCLLDVYPLNCKSMVVSPSSSVASKIVGMGGVAGDKEMPRAPTAKLKVIVTSDVEVDVISALRNVSAVFEFADGRVYTGVGCSVTNAPEHSNDEGEMDVELEMIACIPA